ncbi:MAG TPA: DUF3017 domain-containing protein [Pedococcus sp.]
MTAPRLGWWWAATPVLVAGLGLFALDRVRLAGFVLAAGLGLSAALRLVLPASAAGGLAVRRRWVDVLTMTVLGAGLFVITAVLDLRPRG